jgi:hypothetical protein
MVLKALYLSGGNVEKADFRELLARGEREIATGEPSGMTVFSSKVLATLPLGFWRAQREENHATLVDAIGSCAAIDILRAESGCSPFSAIVVFETSALRSIVREALVHREIYPAILWDLGGYAEGDDRAIDLGRRSLSIHCDFRYSKEDMRRVADELVRAVRAGGG